MVDDEPYITDLLGAALRFEGFEVDTAATGARCHRPGGAQPPRPGAARHHAARRRTAPRCAVACGPRACARPCCSSPPATPPRTRWRGSPSAATTTSPSRSASTSWWHASTPCCGAVYPATASDERLSFSDLEMDEETHEVWRQGELIELTATEFNLLRYLLENARRVLSKSEILDHVWSFDFVGRPQHRRDLHQLPAQEDGPLRSAADPHDPRGRLQPAPSPRAGVGGPARPCRSGAGSWSACSCCWWRASSPPTSSRRRRCAPSSWAVSTTRSTSPRARRTPTSYQVYQRDLHAGDRTPVTDPGAWIAELRTTPSQGSFVPPVSGRAPTPRLNPVALASRLSSDAYVEVIDKRGRVVFQRSLGFAVEP